MGAATRNTLLTILALHSLLGIVPESLTVQRRCTRWALHKRSGARPSPKRVYLSDLARVLMPADNHHAEHACACLRMNCAQVYSFVLAFAAHTLAGGKAQRAFVRGFAPQPWTTRLASLRLRGGGGGAEGDGNDEYNNQPPPPPAVYGQYGNGGAAGYDAYQNYGPGYGQYGDERMGVEDDGSGAYRGYAGDWRGRYGRGRAWGRARGRGRFYSRGSGGGGSGWADDNGGAEVLHGGYGSYYRGAGGRGRFRSRCVFLSLTYRCPFSGCCVQCFPKSTRCLFV